MEQQRTSWPLLALFLILFCPATLLAQQLEWRQFAQEQGLHNTFIYDVKQDLNGYLWLATGKGLYRFNGAHFTRFGVEEGLGDEFVTAIHIGSSGQIWVGDFKGGIAVGQGGEFTVLEHSAAEGPIRGFVASEGQVLALGQRSGPVLVGQDTTMAVFGLVENEQSFSLLLLDEKRALLGSNMGLSLWKKTADLWVKIGPLPYFPKTGVRSLVRVNENTLVVGTESQGVVKLVENREQKVLEVTPLSAPLQGIVHKIVPISDDECWVGTSKGLWLLSGTDTSTHLSLSLKPDKLQGFTNSGVLTMFQSGSGRLWVGTNGAGCWELRPDSYEFYSPAITPDLAGISCLVRVPGSGVVFGGTDRGLVKCTMEFQKNHGPIVLETQTADWGELVRSLTLDSQGQLWIGTDKGVYRGPADGEFQATNFKLIWDKSPVEQLSVDEAGRVWAATTLKGAVIFDADGEEVKSFSTRNGLLHNQIMGIHHNDGQHWLGTQGTDLTVIEDSAVGYIPQADGRYLHHTAFVADSGQMVVGTMGEGLFRLQNDTLIPAPEGDWLKGQASRGIVAGRHLMLLADRKVAVVDRSRQKVIREYDLRPLDGFLIRSSSFLVDDGGLLIAGGEGLCWIPTNDAPYQPETGVAIAGVSVSGSPHALEMPLALPYQQYRFRFEYEGVCLEPELELQYQFRLDGFDSEWLPVTQDQVVEYTGLEDGEYTFVVRSAPRGWPFLGNGTAFSFTIRTPYWKTWWFYLAVGLGVIGLGMTIIRVRTYRLRLNNIRLEKQVAERTDKIRQQNREIRQFTYSVTHDLKSPVNSLLGFVKMINAQPDAPMEEKSEVLGMMETTAQRLRHNLDGLMNVIQARETAPPQAEKINVLDVWSDLKTNLNKLIRENQAVIRTDFQSAQIWFNRDNLFSILHNLVSNAIKYASPERGPLVHIHTAKTPEGYVIKVADNGLGIDLDKHGKDLFAMFKRIHTKAEGSGVGLHLLKEMIERNGGSIEVESEPGVGSTFIVRLPLEE